MPITIELTHDNRLLVMHYLDPLTLEEINDAVILVGQAYLDKTALPIHSINDFSSAHGLSPEVLARGLVWNAHPKQGHILLVLDSFIVSHAATLFNTLTRKDIRIFTTFANAQAYALSLLHMESAQGKNAE
jgi:hypothetical protein